MKSVEKGELAQLKAELRAVEKGYVVARPLTPTRYDLLIDDGNKIWRIQVKYANGIAVHTNNAVTASLGYVDRAKVNHAYKIEEVDAFIIYVPKVESLLWFPAEKICGKLKLQIKISGKIQKNSIWYEDYLW